MHSQWFSVLLNTEFFGVLSLNSFYIGFLISILIYFYSFNILKTVCKIFLFSESWLPFVNST